MNTPDPNRDPRTPPDAGEDLRWSRLARGIESLSGSPRPPQDLARRAFEASRPAILARRTLRSGSSVSSSASWTELLRFPSLARLAMAASILLALAWAGRAWWTIDRTGPDLAEAPAVDPAPPADLVDEPPSVAEPLLVAMLGVDASEWTANFADASGVEALAVLEARRTRIDDYDAEFEAIIGDLRDAKGM